ncbi:CHASE3 domain-containing protein [Novosphingobium flavum]|uniref:histidine kinase n=1 Tax=Novosphingobium flavum TaxID=1778672 RepID=A0A7X1KL12_9SPHN|nr:CHASE3 domain-containing protein [Novosphingobium flavum]MBC2665111.1 CHASE3 domain-containing protein [Novosphingobium flavum]
MAPGLISRWRRGPHLKTLLLLTLVAATMIGAVLLVWKTIDAERSQRAQAGQTNAVLLALHDLSRTAVNAETGQRGYFITLDRRYLSPYIVAREQYRPTIARLRELMGGDISPRKRELLSEIEHLSVAKFAEMDETVAEIRGGGLLEARRRILTDEGQDVMERLRRAIGELETLELASFNTSRDEATASEARILPILAILLVFIVFALGLGLMQVIRTADAEARAEHAAELALARDQADLLARELNHRVKNLFAVVLAIVKMTGRDQPEAKPVVDRIAERIHALLMAHEVTQGRSAKRSARLSDLVEVTLKPYRSPENGCRINGPELELPERAVVPFGLALHELATNAVKYGAWAQPGGELTVDWQVSDGRLRLDWRESHPPRPVDPAATTKRGFGSTLVEGSARQLGGRIERDMLPGGIVVRIEIPLGE